MISVFRTHFFRLIATLLVLTLLSVSAQSADQLEREMVINRVQEIGLEIWSENNPVWLTQVRQRGPKYEFVAETPVNYYPPASMHYMTFPGMAVEPGEMREVAEHAIQQAARNFKVPSAKISDIQIMPAKYGELSGYEATFSGRAHKERMDIKMFIGNAKGKGPVSMYVYTLKGKLGHLRESIRRSWQNVKYLN